MITASFCMCLCGNELWPCIVLINKFSGDSFNSACIHFTLVGVCWRKWFRILMWKKKKKKRHTSKAIKSFYISFSNHCLKRLPYNTQAFSIFCTLSPPPHSIEIFRPSFNVNKRGRWKFMALNTRHNVWASMEIVEPKTKQKRFKNSTRKNIGMLSPRAHSPKFLN